MICFVEETCDLYFPTLSKRALELTHSPNEWLPGALNPWGK